MRFPCAMTRGENSTDIFRPYSRPNSFRAVQICLYPSPNIQYPIPYPYLNTQITYLWCWYPIVSYPACMVDTIHIRIWIQIEIWKWIGYERISLILHLFHISIQIRIRIRIVSTMTDRIRLDINIINMRFEYSDMDTILDVGYPNSDTDISQPL